MVTAGQSVVSLQHTAAQSTHTMQRLLTTDPQMCAVRSDSNVNVLSIALRSRIPMQLLLRTHWVVASHRIVRPE